MTDEETRLANRFAELSDRAAARGVYTRTDFLNLAQQTLLEQTVRRGAAVHVTLCGGADYAERRIAVFGTEADCGFPYEPELTLLRISPRSEKFGEALSHRDVLGALLSLGVQREKLGDIFLDGKTAYVVALDTVAPFLTENLTRVRHTDVTCGAVDALPEGLAAPPEPQTVLSTSERLDCIVAAVYNMSRASARALFEQEKVFVNGAARTSPADPVRPGDIVSVRGTGRFLYHGAAGETKKGRLKISVGVFR